MARSRTPAAAVAASDARLSADDRRGQASLHLEIERLDRCSRFKGRTVRRLANEQIGFGQRPLCTRILVGENLDRVPIPARAMESFARSARFQVRSKLHAAPLERRL